MKVVTEKKCEKCEVIFQKLPNTSSARWIKQRFCSVSCSGTLIKIGVPLPDNIYKGTVKKSLTIAEMIERGQKYHKWKGGISGSFLKAVALKRDDFTCQKCGYKEDEIMEVDHIKPKSLFPELSRDINNLMTLCPNCHRRKTNEELRAKGHNTIKKYAFQL